MYKIKFRNVIFGIELDRAAINLGQFQIHQSIYLTCINLDIFLNMIASGCVPVPRIVYAIQRQQITASFFQV